LDDRLRLRSLGSLCFFHDRIAFFVKFQFAEYARTSSSFGLYGLFGFGSLAFLGSCGCRLGSAHADLRLHVLIMLELTHQQGHDVVLDTCVGTNVDADVFFAQKLYDRGEGHVKVFC
jgi:hypothetical protein